MNLCKLVGYAATWGAVTRNENGYYDRLACGAFGKATDWSDVAALWNHDFKRPLAYGHMKSGPGRLILREDGRGLAFEIEPFDREWIASAIADIRARKVRRMSVGFNILEGSTETLASGLVVFTITRAELGEVSPVYSPADRETSVSLLEVCSKSALVSQRVDRQVIRVDPSLMSQPRRRLTHVGMTVNC